MQTIKIGGVTEHFNLPWNLAVEQNKFQAQGVDLQWQFFAGGTGVMTQALQSGELDLAILLTEGFIAAASNGLLAKIVKEYITSPLGWGIFTGAQSQFYSVYNRLPKKYAISRIGSGSHLMALIHAQQRGEQVTPQDLIEVKSMQGAMESLSLNQSQIFYWEKYTTQPYVQNGTARLIGEFGAPWSGFLIVATDQAIRHKAQAIHTVLEIINHQSKTFVADPNSIPLLQERFKMSQQDAQTWLQSTVWSTDYTIRLSGLQNAQNALVKIGSAIPQLNVAALCHTNLMLT